VTRRVVIACLVHHAYREGFESPTAIATDISGVRPVSIITGIKSGGRKKSELEKLWVMRFVTRKDHECNKVLQRV
jgi:hypothetical protein